MKKILYFALLALLWGCSGNKPDIQGVWRDPATEKKNFGSIYIFYSDNTGKYKGSTSAPFTWSYLPDGRIEVVGSWGTTEIFEIKGHKLVSPSVTLTK